MPRTQHFAVCIRRSAFAALCGVLLMLVQVAGAAEHLSARAAAAAGAPADGPLGFLNICTALGYSTRAVDDIPGAPRHSAAHGCALCAMACAAGSAVLADSPELPAPPSCGKGRGGIAVMQRIALFPWRYGLVRGPPALPFV